MRISSRDGGAGAADVVGLPEREVISAMRSCWRPIRGAARGDRDAVELLEEIGDAATLEHDGAAGDLGGVRGEDGRDADAAEQSEGLVAGVSGQAESTERSAKAAALGCGFGRELGGETAAFAVIGLGEIDELEVEGEGAGEVVGAGEVSGEGVDGLEDVQKGWCGGAGIGCGAGLGFGLGFGFAEADGVAAEGLDGFKESGSGLLAEDLAEQGTEGPDVAAEGCGLELGAAGLELGEAVGPAAGGPEGRHS